MDRHSGDLRRPRAIDRQVVDHSKRNSKAASLRMSRPLTRYNPSSRALWTKLAACSASAGKPGPPSRYRSAKRWAARA